MNQITDIEEDLANGIPSTERVARRRTALMWGSGILLVGSYAIAHLVWPALTPFRIAAQIIGLAYNFRLVPTPRAGSVEAVQEDAALLAREPSEGERDVVERESARVARAGHGCERDRDDDRTSDLEEDQDRRALSPTCRRVDILGDVLPPASAGNPRALKELRGS